MKAGLTPDELYSRAIEKWGEEAQVKMLMEEMGELLTALNKHGRNKNGSSKEEIKNEIVDLQITLDQAKEIYFEDELEYREMKRGALMYLSDLLEGVEP